MGNLNTQIPNSSSTRPWLTSLVTCSTQSWRLEKYLSIWTESLRSAQTENSNQIRWKDASLTDISILLILQTPAKLCYRWESVFSRGLHLSSLWAKSAAPGVVSGAETGSDDRSCGSVWRGKEHLCESAAEILRASRWRNSSGWESTEILWSSLFP